jgi:hypothetical protein
VNIVNESAYDADTGKVCGSVAKETQKVFLGVKIRTIERSTPFIVIFIN